jgi:hypothetical protein
MTFEGLKAVKVFTPSETITHAMPSEIEVSSGNGHAELILNDHGTWHYYYHCPFVVIAEPKTTTE